jgi:hypothetical protein
MSRSTLDWLLEEDEPSIRYLTLAKLLGMSVKDDKVKAAKAAIGQRGWAAVILGRQKPGGWWQHEENLYRPKYVSTNWMLLILSDLGLTREDPRIARAAEMWRDRFAKRDGGFGSDGSNRSHLCITGNTARALIKFGYADDPKVKSALHWLVKAQATNGGWSCYGSGGNLDSWEGMSAFAELPRQKWNRGIKNAVEKGAEFYLRKALDQQGDRYEPWYRFHYPVHYYYDLLVGLDFITALGYGDDKRLAHAISILRGKRVRDPAGGGGGGVGQSGGEGEGGGLGGGAEGRWNLDAVHPDIEGGTADWYSQHPQRSPIPFTLERPGQPSKMITLRALLVLQRLD